MSESFHLRVTAGCHRIPVGGVINGEKTEQRVNARKGDIIEHPTDLSLKYPEKFVRVKGQPSTTAKTSGGNTDQELVEDDPNRPAYEEMSKEALLTVATDLELPVSASMRKGEIIAALDEENGTKPPSQ